MSIEKSAQQNFETLEGNPYPGRGIIIGADASNKNIYQIYWIMGRSSNSRNRVFITDEQNFMKTRAFDESKLEDPSLIIYYPAKHSDGAHIITNGDQTDTVYDAISSGSTFEAALETREFEPDAPNFTPRISGIVDLNSSDYSYKLSILKTLHNDENNSVRYFYNYRATTPGFGHMITTYETDGNPIPSFKGEPQLLPLFDSVEENLEKYWNTLNSDNKVSLMVKKINIESGKFEIAVKNKLEK